ANNRSCISQNLPCAAAAAAALAAGRAVAWPGVGKSFQTTRRALPYCLRRSLSVCSERPQNRHWKMPNSTIVPRAPRGAAGGGLVDGDGVVLVGIPRRMARAGAGAGGARRGDLGLDLAVLDELVVELLGGDAALGGLVGALDLGVDDGDERIQRLGADDD